MLCCTPRVEVLGCTPRLKLLQCTRMLELLCIAPRLKLLQCTPRLELLCSAPMLESLHSARRLSCYTVRHGQAIALHANARGTVLRYTATLMYCAARERFWDSMQHAKAVYERTILT